MDYSNRAHTSVDVPRSWTAAKNRDKPLNGREHPTEERSFADAAERRRFELREHGMIAFADYYRQGDRLVIPHVESPPPLRGKGTSDRLMRAVATHARARQLKILPLCGYARAWFRRHPDFADVLA